MHVAHVDHAQKKKQSGYVRALALLSGYLFKKVDDNTTKVQVCIQTDLKGLIPKMVVNKFAKKAPKKWIESVQKGYAELKTKGVF